MPIIQVTVTEDIEVPKGSLVLLAPTGVVSAIRLPDGTDIKPWITYEKETAGQDPVDISYDDLIALGVESGLDYSRTVDGDIDEIQPETLSAA